MYNKSLPFPKELESNRPAGGLSVRMLVALAGLVYMCFIRVLSSRYIAECLLHAFVSVHWSKYVAVHVLQRAVVANRQPSACRWRKQTMSANKTKKVKMATKSCPECDQQIPVACKSCPCGYVFISRKLLNAKVNERPSPTIADKLDSKRRRTERIRRDRIDSPLTSDMENRRRSRANSQSDPIRRGRGRPKTVGLKKQEEEKEKQEKEVDIYASLSDEKAFVFSVALAEINRKILGQTLIL